MQLDAGRGAATVPILMYHSISTGGSRGFRRFAVAPRLFEEHVRVMRDQGHATLSVGDLVEHRISGAAPLRRPVVLTFDDGFDDFYTAAMPILTKYNVAATLYVVSGCVGATSRWLAREGNRAMLSWSRLAELRKLGIEIGAHTMTHKALDTIPAAEARAEIEGSKRDLEDRLGEPVTSFAYPFGFYSKRVREMVIAAGFTSACAVRYGSSPLHDDRFALARHIARHDASAEDIGAILAGRSPAAALLYDRARSNAWKLVRQAWHGALP
ncbi:MAG: polysaccharide deacetylase family protein [Xanthobacteraceae bacterium]